MEKFTLYNPVKVVFGGGRLDDLKKYARSFGKRCFILMGSGSVEKYGYLDRVKKNLKKSGVEYTVFSGVEPNPRVKTIDRAKKEAYKFKSEFIIALGGGSVMDGAKGISVSYFTPESSVWDYIIPPRGEKKLKPQKVLPIIAIPTVAATGSEMDGIAVISNGETKQKVSLFSQKIFPELAIVDPELTYSLDKKHTAYGRVDIITTLIKIYRASKRRIFLSSPRPRSRLI